MHHRYPSIKTFAAEANRAWPKLGHPGSFRAGARRCAVMCCPGVVDFCSICRFSAEELSSVSVSGVAGVALGSCLDWIFFYMLEIS